MEGTGNYASCCISALDVLRELLINSSPIFSVYFLDLLLTLYFPPLPSLLLASSPRGSQILFLVLFSFLKPPRVQPSASCTCSTLSYPFLPLKTESTKLTDTVMVCFFFFFPCLSCSSGSLFLASIARA